ncbi:cadherin-like domain-containing protein [Bradyrhizobium sp. 40]|uniref:cadherin-like domain-containing protein n=1 Tax=Bradyrhizobium sp. 40 TaxID=2782674 RepID=UPI001FFF0216|nr:cadherin-like domain-containing protein [Bradyrhizobium sp. 40]UPJ44130.1 cadherin-like domain-containing protein [Bradyrhizobium sp. 40]
MSTVTNIAQLNAAIVAADGVTSPGIVTITLANDISLGGNVLKGINLHDGVTLVIEGSGHVLSGGGTQRGFFVYAGTVEINDLLITDMLARGGNGGTGDTGGGGGGGAGLGAGLFIGANVPGNPGSVTLSNVSFSLNAAHGGIGSTMPFLGGGTGGGGGLGGDGGALSLLTGASGGGGIGGDGGASIHVEGGAGGTGLIPGAASAASGGFGVDSEANPAGAGGSYGGGGGGGGGGREMYNPIYGYVTHPGNGGGGGIGGVEGGAGNSTNTPGAPALIAGGAGGYGGGGGGGDFGGGDGGFGGGGGAANSADRLGTGAGEPGFGAGDGGFGGGGGGHLLANGAAGFGGGGEVGGAGYGGGGLGAGGAIFVQEGASLSIAGSTAIGFNSVAGGGTSNAPLEVEQGFPAIRPNIPAGQAFGNGIYLQGNNTLTFRPNGSGTEPDAQGNPVALGQYIFDVIGDDVGSAAAATYSGAANYTMGQTGIVVDGTGTLVLLATNTYSGATTVAKGTLDVEGSIAMSSVIVQTGGTLSGIGTTGAVTIQSGGLFDPGADGMHTGNLSFSSGASWALQLRGIAAGTFEQVIVNGTVTLSGATLNLSLLAGYTPAAGNSFRIIDNDGSADAVRGTFAGHAEGSTFTSGGASYSITYQGGDGNDVVLTTLSTNTSPVAVADAGSITEDTAPNPISGNVLTNDSDADGNVLSVANAGTIVLAHGSLVIHADGSYAYTLDNSNPAVDTLNTGQTLVDHFTYTVSDGNGGTSAASLDITIHGKTNSLPPDVTGTVTLAAITEDFGARLITQAELLENVSDADGPSLTATGLAIATGAGTLVDNHDGTWTYTSALNDDTQVTFSYEATDGSTAVADSATLDITAVNDAPGIVGGVTLAAVAEDSGTRLITQAQLLGNVTDPEGQQLTASGLAIATGAGTLVDNHDGSWSYTPAANDDSSVSFSYQVTDGTISVGDSATLDITPLDDGPVVAGAVTLAAIAEDSGARLITQAELLGNAMDVDGPSLAAAHLAIATGGGTLVDNQDGTWSYTPAPNDDHSVSFSYEVTDGTLLVAAGATLDITPVNDAPVVGGAVIFAAIAEDSGARLITQAQLLGNVTDADGPSLTAAGFAIATGSGSLVDNHNGTWSYMPGLNDDSSVAFSWRVTDGTTSVADTGTLDITPLNDAPVNTTPASQSILPNRDVAITGLAVGDVDSTALSTTLHVEHGTLIIGAVGGGATVAGSGSSTLTLTGSAAQIDAVLGTANNLFYHSTFDFSGTDHLTMTTNDGALSDVDVLNLSVFQQVQAQTFGDITRPAITLDTTGHIILDQPAIDFASVYGMKGLYVGLPSSTPFPPVFAPDFHL